MLCAPPLASIAVCEDTDFYRYMADPGGFPSPPLEERAGERRPILDAAAHGDLPEGCCTNRSGVLVENDGLLSLSLSSKGGEGSGATASER